jgi:creatinine amidohydrolase
MPIEVEWERMTAPELRDFAKRRHALVILPVGALEQHGPHLPVSTDIASACAASIAAARLVAADIPVAVLPGIWLGMSENMHPFGGTVSADYAAFHGVIRSVARSLKTLGIERLLIVHGHGGNVAPLAVAVREIAVELAMPIGAATPWIMAPEAQAAVFESAKAVQHACEGETSLMLAIAGDLVRVDKLNDAVGGSGSDIRLPKGFSRAYSFAELGPGTGVQGDPRTASAAKGRQFLEIQARAIAKVIRDEQLWSPPDPVWRPGRGLETTVGRPD